MRVIPLAEVAQYFLELKFPGEILITILMHDCLYTLNSIILKWKHSVKLKYETAFIQINVLDALQFMSPENEVYETTVLQKQGILAFERQFEWHLATFFA